MDVREKLVELLDDIQVRGEDFTDYEIYGMRLPDTVSNEDVASHLIAHGVTVQEWISVKDRLPDKRGEYLCYYKFEPDSPDVVCENTYQGSGLWLSEMDKVTQWQPMPQPPKGE